MCIRDSIYIFYVSCRVGSFWGWNSRPNANVQDVSCVPHSPAYNPKFNHYPIPTNSNPFWTFGQNFLPHSDGPYGTPGPLPSSTSPLLVCSTTFCRTTVGVQKRRHIDDCYDGLTRLCRLQHVMKDMQEIRWPWPQWLTLTYRGKMESFCAVCLVLFVTVLLRT